MIRARRPSLAAARGAGEPAHPAAETAGRLAAARSRRRPAADRARPRGRLNSSAIYAGIGIGTVLGGLILPAGVAAAALTAAIIAAAAGLYLMLTRRYR